MKDWAMWWIWTALLGIMYELETIADALQHTGVCR